METVKEQATVTKPAAEPGRRMMRLAIIVLFISQCLPFYKSNASLESHYTGWGHGTYQNAYADAGYESYVKSGDVSTGFEMHPYAFLL